jgi:hypothetical protein
MNQVSLYLRNTLFFESEVLRLLSRLPLRLQKLGRKEAVGKGLVLAGHG